MRKLFALLAPFLLVSLVLAGCGKSSGPSTTTAHATTTAATESSTLDTAATVPSATGASCPTSNTTRFAKIRFATSLGLAAGTFHRYLYTPYKAGAFAKGAPKRFRTILKAAASAVFAAHEVDKAISDAKANPTLCKALIAPLSTLEQKLNDLKTKLRGGDTGSLEDVNTSVGGVLIGSAKQGIAVKEESQG